MQERKTAWYPTPRLLAVAQGWQASISATCLLSSTLAWSSVNYLHLLLQCRNPVPCLVSNAGDGDMARHRGTLTRSHNVGLFLLHCTDLKCER